MRARYTIPGSIAIGLLFSFQGCGGNQVETKVCGPGDTRTCFGPGACSGAQECLQDGTGYGPCDCGSIGDAGVAGSATGGSSGSAGSSGFSGSAGTSGSGGS